MALEKERLMAYFQEHYLSRQEVLYKLPLSLSIDAFWPELLNRRKATAAVLPLYNAAGMPYWYVETQRMVHASERLCEAAMAQADGFDPYRAQMTSAMTEEMFFTSFVEGAQIPLQEAMDFLQRGTEPENIQEQMIWNNRCAWQAMISALYLPLDEPFVRSLAWALTQEMDNAAEDYRQTDSHPIAAMRAERYSVPSAISLPDRMREYYDFLRDGGVHPLIKSAVGQAYILVVRPFPEGNERLARMISSAVLLRSGYDLFRDISISGVIARENYRYYKAMREILRGENGGDLTYFVEYYLELLARALEEKKTRERHREEEALEQERRMAREPLQSAPTEMRVPSAMTPDELLAVDDSIIDADTEDAGKGDDGPEVEAVPVETPGPRRRHQPPWPLCSQEEFLEKVDALKDSPYERCREYPEHIRAMLSHGMTTFTVTDWSRILQIPRRKADHECRALYDRGMLEKHLGGDLMRYSFRIAPDGAATESPPQWATRAKLAAKASAWAAMSFEDKVETFSRSKSNIRRRAAETIREMLAKGIYRFHRSEWVGYMGVPKENADDACDVMAERGIIRNVTPEQRTALYEFCLQEEAADPALSTDLTETLRVLAADPLSSSFQRIGQFLLKLIDSGREHFAPKEWGETFDVSKTTYCTDVRRAMNMGLIHKMRDGHGRCIYRLNRERPADVRSDALTSKQKQYLATMYGQFGQKEFCAEDCSKLLHTDDSTMYFHLKNFAERGILETIREPGKANRYVFAVSSEEHPECFRQVAGPLPPSQQQEQDAERLMESAAGRATLSA